MSNNGLLIPSCIDLGDTGELNIKFNPAQLVVKFTILEKMLGSSYPRASVTLTPDATFGVMRALAKILTCTILDAKGQVIR